jgi:hypothetical protein
MPDLSAAGIAGQRLLYLFVVFLLMARSAEAQASTPPTTTRVAPGSRVVGKVATDSAAAASVRMAANTTQCGNDCVEVGLKLVLDKIGGAISNPEARWFEKRKAETNPAYFLQNLKTLAEEATAVAAIKTSVRRDAEIAQFILGAQKLKWEVIAAYLGTQLETAIGWTKWLGPGGTVVLGVFEATPTGYGDTFEFCEASTNPDKVKNARAFILYVMQSYEPAPFRQIARRVTRGQKCANVMASYLMTS